MKCDAIAHGEVGEAGEVDGGAVLALVGGAVVAGTRWRCGAGLPPGFPGRGPPAPGAPAGGRIFQVTPHSLRLPVARAPCTGPPGPLPLPLFRGQARGQGLIGIGIGQAQLRVQGGDLLVQARRWRLRFRPSAFRPCASAFPLPSWLPNPVGRGAGAWRPGPRRSRRLRAAAEAREAAWDGPAQRPFWDGNGSGALLAALGRVRVRQLGEARASRFRLGGLAGCQLGRGLVLVGVAFVAQQLVQVIVVVARDSP